VEVINESKRGKSQLTTQMFITFNMQIEIKTEFVFIFPSVYPKGANFHPQQRLGFITDLKC
jgi:hypothetical protein